MSLIICGVCNKVKHVQGTSRGTEPLYEAMTVKEWCSCPRATDYWPYTFPPPVLVDQRDAELARLRAELEQAKAATERALELAVQYGGIDGDHHKAWVIDQMVRALLVNETDYSQWVTDACNGEEGPNTYDWDTGVIP